MERNQQRILLFDIDGTLMDSAREGRACFGRALADVYGVTGPIDAYDMAGKTDWQIVTDLMQLAGLSLEEIESRCLDAFLSYAPHVKMAAPTFKMRILPGVGALLTCLQGEPQFILGLVTGNVREAVPHKLRAVGLDPELFTFGAYSSERSLNMIMLGALLANLDLFPLEAVEKALEAHLPERHKKFLPANKEALRKGAEYKT